MNVRIVTMFLRLLPQLKIWKRVNLLARNVVAKIPRDCLTDLVIVMEARIMNTIQQVARLVREELAL